ncbi:MAG: metal-sensitive transcriptional regulator [Bacillota bacterium]|nr:metal-sensitive transcriptional regulator [Bacillota bacterium]
MAEGMPEKSMFEQPSRADMDPCDESPDEAGGAIAAGSGEGERRGASLDLDALVLSENARSDIVSRLKRIEGQARGIRKMIEDGRSCEEVVIQVAALKAAVAQVGIAIAGAHLVDCVARDMGASPGNRAALARFVKIFSKLS